MPRSRQDMVLSRWELVPDIVGPSGSISVELHGRKTALITLHFGSRDLMLNVPHIYALTWEFEGPANTPLPRPLPHFEASDVKQWVYPLLKVDNDAEWLQQVSLYYERQGAPLGHFFLVSMDDIIEFVGRSDVDAKWVPSK
jgi:hypothetical protein